MHRILLVLLVACGQLDRVGDTADMVDWLERYDRVRACVISPLGDSVTQGAAVAMLEGGDCTEPIAELVRDIPFDDAAAAWWRGIATSLVDPLPRRRAAAIDAADLVNDSKRRSLGLPAMEYRPVPLPPLKAGITLKVGDQVVRPNKSVSFHGGAIVGSDGTNDFYIARNSTITRPTPAITNAEADPIAVLERGESRIVVRRDPHTAYSVSATRGGKSSGTWRGPAGTHLVDVYRNPAFDWLELLIADDRYTSYRVELSPRWLEPQVVRTDGYVDRGREICRDFSLRDYAHVWRLEGTSVSHLFRATAEHSQLSAAVSDAQFDCRRDRALVLHRPNALERDVLERCGSECFRVFHSKSRVPGVAGLLDDQTWIYAASSEGVLAIHREGQPVELYRLPSSLHKVVAFTVLDRPYVVIDERTSYTLIPLS